MTEKSNLGPRDWIIAGLAALAEGGVEAVRVERLAKQLQTTKGSCYWLFADRPALLEAMLALWEQEGTLDLIACLVDVADPAERLRKLMAAILSVLSGSASVARTESAMRSWAARDSAVGARFARMETERLRVLIEELSALGYARQDGAHLAKAIYLALIGLCSVRPYAPELAEDQALVTLVEQVIAAAPH